MTAFLLLANTAESKSHSFLDALPHMAGMAVVLVTLAVLWGVCVFTAKMVGIASAGQEAVTLGSAPLSSPDSGPVPAGSGIVPSSDDSRIAPEIVAVIAAAVVTVTGNQPIRIVSIKPMSTSWERAGRQSVLTSHRIR